MPILPTSSIVRFRETIFRLVFAYHFFNATVLNRAFIQAVFIFTISGIFFIVSQSAASSLAWAKSTRADQSPANAGAQTGSEQQPLLIGHSRPAQQMGMQRPLRVKPSPEAKNEIKERCSGQIKREDFSRNLERRRQQLRQESGRGRP